MSNRTYLFIGGPADGRRMSIPERDHNCCVPGEQDHRGYRETAWYRKELFRYGAANGSPLPEFETFVFIYEDMKLSEVMARLFDRYPEPAKKMEYPGRFL